MTKLKTMAIAIASIVIFTNITHAQIVKPNYSANYEVPLTVKYIGNDENYLTFQVTVLSPITGRALFSIADKKEGELYFSSIQSNFKDQTVKIEKKDEQVLNFKLVIGKKAYSKSFSVNTSKIETTIVEGDDITML